MHCAEQQGGTKDENQKTKQKFSHHFHRNTRTLRFQPRWGWSPSDQPLEDAAWIVFQAVFSFTNDWSRTGPLLLGLQRKTHAVRPIVANFQDFRDSSIKLDAVARRRHFLQLFHQNARQCIDILVIQIELQGLFDIPDQCGTLHDVDIFPMREYDGNRHVGKCAGANYWARR